MVDLVAALARPLLNSPVQTVEGDRLAWLMRGWNISYLSRMLSLLLLL
jgi:hypothetical protein